MFFFWHKKTWHHLQLMFFFVDSDVSVFPNEMMRKGFPHKVRVEYQADFEHQVIVLREIIVRAQSFQNQLTNYLTN